MIGFGKVNDLQAIGRQDLHGMVLLERDDIPTRQSVHPVAFDIV